MKPTIFSLSLCFLLSLGIFSQSYAGRPNFAFHRSLVYSGEYNTLVSNKDGVLRYSDNGGKSWNDVSGKCMDGNAFINSVKRVEATNLFVAVGFYETPKNANGETFTESRYCSSINGIRWQAVNVMDSDKDPAKYRGLNDIAYGNGFFVAVGQVGDRALVEVLDWNNANINKLVWKEMCKGWICEGEISADSVINSIDFGNGKFVAAGDSSTIDTFELSSLSGQRYWNIAKGHISGGKSKLTQVLYVANSELNNGKTFVAIGEGSYAWYSVDGGVNWSLGEGLHGSANFNQLIYIKPYFVIAAEKSTIWYSDNGMNWMRATGMSGANYNLNQLTFIKDKSRIIATGADDEGKESIWFSDCGAGVCGQSWWKSTFPFMYIKNESEFTIVNVCTKHKGDQKMTCAIKRSLEDKNKVIALGEDLQPEAGLSEGDTICVVTVQDKRPISTRVSHYFVLRQPAVIYKDKTLIKFSGAASDDPKAPGIQVWTEQNIDPSKALNQGNCEELNTRG